MLKIEIPTVYPIHDNAFVTIPSESWKALCNTLNEIATVVNSQTQALVEQQEEINSCNTNTIKLAKIVEEIYEEII